MSFLYPLGLLGLIGIPILIIIYIIKTKYTEQTVASTYLWLLSERFLKRRNPFSKISGIISLILQILAITLISVGIAHPMFTLPGAAYEYVFILDASASMQMQQGNTTRFEVAKAQIAEEIEEATNGSRYTLVMAGGDTIVIFDKLTDKDSALTMLQEQEAGSESENLADAAAIAQRYFNENTAAKISLYSDAEHGVGENIRLVNVAKSEKNFAITNVSYAIAGGKLSVLGDLISYSGEDTLEVSLYVDGEFQTTYLGVVSEEQPARFQLTCQKDTFSEIYVQLDVQDDFPQDNQVHIYDTKSDSAYNTLIVSDKPLFLEANLVSFGHVHYSIVSTKDFDEELDGDVAGYGLYIFDGYTPSVLPNDGAVMFVNPTASVENSGFSVQMTTTLENYGRLDKNTSSASMVQTLLAHTDDESVFIKRYVKCGTYRNFTTLYSYRNQPVIFAGTNDYGNRQVVIAFDLHDSEIALQTNIVALMWNFLEYSFPEVVEQKNYFVGDTVQVNILANCESVRVESPKGSVSYLSTAMAVSELNLTETGTYTITATVEGAARKFQIFAAVPDSERTPAGNAVEISLQGQATEGGFDGSYDPLLIVFICLAVIFAAEWGVYCYEKRQLR